jgi:hypothetical protein
MPPSPPNSETETLFYVPIDGWGLYEPNVMTEDRLPPPVAPSITAAFDPLLAKARQMHQQQREATTTGSGGIGRRTRRPSTTTPTTMIPSASGQSESTTVGGILKTEENGGPTGAGVALDGVVIRTGPGRPRLPSRTLAGRPAATAGREKVISSHHDHDVSTTTTPATGVPGHGGSARRRRRFVSII